VTYEELVPGLSLYCLMPTTDSGLSPFNSVMLVSLGHNGGGNLPGSTVQVAGVCVDDDTGGFGWHVITWGPTNEVDDRIGFTVVVP
jgi:hypothetical protein